MLILLAKSDLTMHPLEAIRKAITSGKLAPARYIHKEHWQSLSASVGNRTRLAFKRLKYDGLIVNRVRCHSSSITSRSIV